MYNDFLCEYLLVLRPNEALLQEILSVKEVFANAYKAHTNTGGKAHIILVKFVQRKAVEAQLIQRLQSISLRWQPFLIELKDYGAFPTHTIYFNIQTTVQIQQLVRQLHDVQSLMRSGDNKPHFITEPFIPLAQKLAPWQFEQGWLEMRHSSFTGKFVADSMTLLSRKHGERRYEPVQRLDFLEQSLIPKQGALFL